MVAPAQVLVAQLDRVALVGVLPRHRVGEGDPAGPGRCLPGARRGGNWFVVADGVRGADVAAAGPVVLVAHLRGVEDEPEPALDVEQGDGQVRRVAGEGFLYEVRDGVV